MKLYTNGCSFTHGHKDYDDNHRCSFAWPHQLEDKFDLVVNEAWRGSSNYRTIRRSMEYLSNIDDPENWVVVIQWTDYIRFEWFVPNIGYVQQPPHRSVFDDRMQHLDEDNIKFIKAKDPSIFHIHNIFSEEDILMKQMHYTLTLQEFLKKRKFAKVIYGCMFPDNCAPWHILKYRHNDDLIKHNSFADETLNLDFLKMLANEIDTSNYLDLSFSEIANNHVESEDDLHPNKVGHALIARYILKEIESRFGEVAEWSKAAPC